MYRAYDFNLLSGVSSDTLNVNLSSLVAILYLSRHASRYPNDGTPEMAACLVTLWFMAAGISQEKLMQWLNEIDPELVTIRSRLEITHTKVVYQPFPALCSPQLMVSSGERLFGPNERDFQYTMQLFQAWDPANSPVDKLKNEVGERETVYDATRTRVLYERWHPTDRFEFVNEAHSCSINT